MAFKDQLSRLRKRKNLTQIDLASKMGVRQYIISSWETGRSEPNISQIIKLSDILDVPTDYLLDKEIIRASSEEEFNKVVENINKDIHDEFIEDIKSCCDNLSKSKKEKIAKIIRELVEY